MILCSALCGHAADSLPGRARVLVTVQTPDAADSRELADLIVSSIEVELAARNIDVVPAPGVPTDSAPAAVKGAAADFLVSGVCRTSGTAVELAVGWYEMGDRRETGRATRRGTLDLAFDSLVAGLVDELVDGQADAIAAAASRRQQESTVAAPPSAVAETALPSTPPGPWVAEAPVPSSGPAPFALAAGSAPFIATFEALSYFPVGIAFSLCPRYQMRAGDGFFGIGLLTGVTAFHGRGAYAEADFYVIPVGADAVYGTMNRNRFDFFVHGGGGPAVLVARPGSGDLLAKVIPYATLGVGCAWTPLDILTILFDAGYTCYFDSFSAIMGFTPSLSVSLNL